MIQQLAKYLLTNRNNIPLADWTVQGFGFLRLRISPTARLHVWHSNLRYFPTPSDIHDHTQWAFNSHIVAGQLVNVRFTEQAGSPKAPTHRRVTIRTGMGGGIKDAVHQPTVLTPLEPELYGPGASYRQDPDEIHRTYAVDGTVTIITQERRETESARVWYPVNGEWVSAEPRPATAEEVDRIGGQALQFFQ